MVHDNGFFATSDDVHHDFETKNSLMSVSKHKDRFFDVSGHGIVFVNAIGSMIRHELKQGERWSVEEGHVVAWNGRQTDKSKEFSKHIYMFEGPGTLITQVMARVQLHLCNHFYGIF